MTISEHGMFAHLIPDDLALGVVLEVAVAFEPTFDDLAEFGGKGFMVEEVVDAEARARRLGRVRRANALLGGPDARQAISI